MMEANANRAPSSPSVASSREQRAFQSYFDQLTAVRMALVDLSVAFDTSLVESEFYARSVNCAWGVLEARRTVLETVAGSGSLSCPGFRYIHECLRAVLREGWARASRKPQESEALAHQLRRLEDRLMPPRP